MVYIEAVYIRNKTILHFVNSWSKELPINISYLIIFNEMDGYLDTRISPSYVRYIIIRARQMKYKNEIIQRIQVIVYQWIFKNLDENWLIIYMSEGQYLPYWKLNNNEEEVVITPQNISRSFPIHHQRGINKKQWINMKLKKHLQLLHKLYPR